MTYFSCGCSQNMVHKIVRCKRQRRKNMLMNYDHLYMCVCTLKNVREALFGVWVCLKVTQFSKYWEICVVPRFTHIYLKSGI